MTLVVVLVASTLVFVSGALLLVWAAHWRARRQWLRMRPTFIDWVVLAVQAERGNMAASPDPEEVEMVTAALTSVVAPPRRRWHT